MWLTHIEADRLRNLKAVGLSLGSGLTLVAGRNGQGKTSLLESIYLMGTGRSFRTRRLDELVCRDGGPLRVSGDVDSRAGRSRLTALIDGPVRRLLVDDVERDLEAFLGHLPVVDLSAERMAVLRGGPDERRRFLDRGVVGLQASFLRALGEYRRVLRQRNALLRGGGSAGRSAELDAWDDRLVLAGAAVHRRRREYAVLLGSRLGEAGRVLFPDGPELTLRYRPSPAGAAEAGAGEFQRVFAEAVGEARARDRAVGHTCRGPHRDDFVVELEGVDLRRFGSAGQVRAAMVALKVAKLALLRQERGESPLFLMDDFDSDLDEVRAAALARFLYEGGFQALVATSKEGMADRLGVPFAKIRMDDGAARIA